MQLISICLTLLLPILTDGLPFEGALRPHNILPRAKSYAIVNVDGDNGSRTSPPPDTTPVATRTIQVTDAGPTVTDTVTKTVTRSSVAASTTTSPSDVTSSTTVPSTTPTPSVVTITVTESAGPTEYYDNGLWHTSYAVKTFEKVVPTQKA